MINFGRTPPVRYHLLTTEFYVCVSRQCICPYRYRFLCHLVLSDREYWLRLVTLHSKSLTFSETGLQ